MQHRTTRLTYIFPCAAGCLKIVVLFAARYIAKNESYQLQQQLWLGFAMSFGAFALCCCYLAIQAIISVFTSTDSFAIYVRSFATDVAERPVIALGFLNGVAGAFEIILLLLVSSATPQISLILFIVTLSQAQMLTSLICDMCGFLWIPIRYSYELTLAGGGIVYLGTIMIVLHPFSAALTQSPALIRAGLAGVAGVISLVNLAMTRRLSSAFKSYWMGSTTTFTGQVITLLIICVLVDPRYAGLHPIVPGVFKDTKLFFFVFGGVLCGVFTSVVVQLLGDIGGFFSTINPVVAGQVLLTAVLIAYDEPVSGRYSPYSFVTGFTLIGAVFIAVGSVLAWVGRWGYNPPTSPLHTTHNTFFKSPTTRAYGRSRSLRLRALTASNTTIPDVTPQQGIIDSSSNASVPIQSASADASSAVNARIKDSPKMMSDVELNLNTTKSNGSRISKLPNLNAVPPPTSGIKHYDIPQSYPQRYSQHSRLEAAVAKTNIKPIAFDNNNNNNKPTLFPVDDQLRTMYEDNSTKDSKTTAPKVTTELSPSKRSILQSPINKYHRNRRSSTLLTPEDRPQSNNRNNTVVNKKVSFPSTKTTATTAHYLWSSLRTKSHTNASTAPENITSPYPVKDTSSPIRVISRQDLFFS